MVQVDKLYDSCKPAVMKDMSASQARNQFADIYEAALDHVPTSIHRRRGGSAVMIDSGDLDALLDAFRFAPEVFMDRGVVSIWLPELKIWGRGGSFVEAQADLLDEIDELIALVESDSAMRAAPETVRELPWIFHLMRTPDDADRLELLFAAREAEQPAGALAVAG